MTTAQNSFWRFPVAKGGAWPQHVQWVCGHVTDLEKGRILETPDGIPVFYDRLRNCPTFRVQANPLCTMLSIATMAIDVTRFGFGVLESLLDKISKLEQQRDRARARERKYEGEVYRQAAGDPTFSVPLSTLRDKTLWEQIQTMRLGIFGGETLLPYDMVTHAHYGGYLRDRLIDQFRWLQTAQGQPDYYLEEEAGARGVNGLRYTVLVQEFQVQMRTDAYFVAWLLDEQERLLGQLRDLMLESVGSVLAVKSHVGTLLSFAPL